MSRSMTTRKGWLGLLVSTAVILVTLIGTWALARGPKGNVVNQPSGTQGVIYGTVVLTDGNCQPGMVGDTNRTKCTSRSVSRKVYLYTPPVPRRHFTDTYYAGDRSPALITQSDGNGHYEIRIRSGPHSILVEDDMRQYCNRFSEREACAVTVRPGERVRHDLKIEHITF
jgi:hypothetical protein